tara:strand:+ start:990 stop:1292 length:303 start_codon:yes stop_codon:yes gene_type:complete
VYGQEFHHDGVILLGNRVALTQLRDAIDDALSGLEPDTSANCELFTADGEGYNVYILVDDSATQSESWLRWTLPYTGSAARDFRDEDETEHPSNVIQNFR